MRWVAISFAAALLTTARMAPAHGCNDPLRNTVSAAGATSTATGHVIAWAVDYESGGERAVRVQELDANGAPRGPSKTRFRGTGETRLATGPRGAELAVVEVRAGAVVLHVGPALRDEPLREVPLDGTPTNLPLVRTPGGWLASTYANGSLELVSVNDDGNVVARTRQPRLAAWTTTKRLHQPPAAAATADGVVFFARLAAPDALAIVRTKSDGSTTQCSPAPCAEGDLEIGVEYTHPHGQWVTASPLDDGVILLAGLPTGIRAIPIGSTGAVGAGVTLDVPRSKSSDGQSFVAPVTLGPVARGRPVLLGYAYDEARAYDERGQPIVQRFAATLGPDGTLGGVERATARVAAATCGYDRCIAFRGDEASLAIDSRDAEGNIVSSTSIEVAPSRTAPGCGATADEPEAGGCSVARAQARTRDFSRVGFALGLVLASVVVARRGRKRRDPRGSPPA